MKIASVGIQTGLFLALGLGAKCSDTAEPPGPCQYYCGNGPPIVSSDLEIVSEQPVRANRMAVFSTLVHWDEAYRGCELEVYDHVRERVASFEYTDALDLDPGYQRVTGSLFVAADYLTPAHSMKVRFTCRYNDTDGRPPEETTASSNWFNVFVEGIDELLLPGEIPELEVFDDTTTYNVTALLTQTEAPKKCALYERNTEEPLDWMMTPDRCYVEETPDALICRALRGDGRVLTFFTTSRPLAYGANQQVRVVCYWADTQLEDELRRSISAFSPYYPWDVTAITYTDWLSL